MKSARKLERKREKETEKGLRGRNEINKRGRFGEF